MFTYIFDTTALFFRSRDTVSIKICNGVFEISKLSKNALTRQ